jgi:beta-glucosidase
LITWRKGQTDYKTGRRGGIRIGGRPVRSTQEEIAKAVVLAKGSDGKPIPVQSVRHYWQLVTIVLVGTTTEWESEAYDRDDLKLPGATDDLVKSILKAVPNAIVVNQSGMPVEFTWLDQAPTLLQAFFGGNECGTAIANAIFGKSNPGGKLPVTWPVSLDDYNHVEFGNAVTTVYTEGLNVGYRWFDAPGRPKSAFPFGFGGSYTTFIFR